MEIGTVDPTPDIDEVLQEPPGIVTVPVRVEGSVQVNALPSRRVQYQTDTVGTDWVKLFPETPKRKVGVLVSIDQDIYVSERGVGGGMIWPAGTPYVFEHAQAVQVKAVTGSTSVGSSVELWAD